MRFFIMDHTIAFLSVAFGVKILASFINRGKKPSSCEYVGKISDILIYPVKGAKGIPLEKAECLHRGLKYPGKDIFDRNFAIIDGENNCLRVNTVPQLSIVKCSVKGEHLILEADGLSPLTLPIYYETNRSKVTEIEVLYEFVEGQDCGDEAGVWISKIVGKDGCRMLYGSQNLKKRQLNLQKDSFKKAARDPDYITFQNNYPLMLASKNSLDDLNTKLEQPVQMNRFRPNLVVSDGNAKAFDEDNWKELWIGDLKFTQLKPCIRCPITTVDPSTGTMHKYNEPLKTLRTFRLNHKHFGYAPMFGINLILDNHLEGGLISVGDPVYILRGKVVD